MKKKSEKVKDLNTSADELNLKANDEAYRQINITSFQQNFKVLIGHYKNEVPVSQLS